MTDFPASTILEQADIDAITPDLDMLKLVAYGTAEKAETMVFGHDGKDVAILTTNTYPTLVQQIIDKISTKGYYPKVYYTSTEAFSAALTWYDQLKTLEEQTRNELQQRASVTGSDAESMIKDLYERRSGFAENDFIMEMVRLSYMAGASDLHFQPEEMGVIMRIRKDGVLKTMLTFSHDEFRKYFVKLKFISGVRLNIDYIPQDGRFDFDVQKNNTTDKIDVRVSFMPGMRGEAIVMRYLDSTKGIMSLSAIGFGGATLEHVQSTIERNYGMILVTGPTGSGKTTTLYSILDKLNQPGKKIITLEDPVEYELPGIQQSQINYTKGYTYASGLKAILRQDPDAIMVGEIRDLETAEIAINAALTGHLVLSTLHTNTAIEAINRLFNMGVEPFLLAPALNTIIGQRLVRKVDPDTLTLRDASYAERAEIEENLKRIASIRNDLTLDRDGKVPTVPDPSEPGRSTADGYRGRIAVVEACAITDEIEQAMMDHASTLDIYSIARANGYLTMQEDAYLKLINHHTTLEEIRRVL